MNCDGIRAARPLERKCERYGAPEIAGYACRERARVRSAPRLPYEYMKRKRQGNGLKAGARRRTFLGAFDCWSVAGIVIFCWDVAR